MLSIFLAAGSRVGVGVPPRLGPQFLPSVFRFGSTWTVIQSHFLADNHELPTDRNNLRVALIDRVKKLAARSRVGVGVPPRLGPQFLPSVFRFGSTWTVIQSHFLAD